MLKKSSFLKYNFRLHSFSHFKQKQLLPLFLSSKTLPNIYNITKNYFPFSTSTKFKLITNSKFDSLFPTFQQRKNFCTSQKFDWNSTPFVTKKEKKIEINNSPIIKEYHNNSCPANDPCEDTHTELSSEQGDLFGVFDGHGGVEASQFCENNLLTLVDYELKFALKRNLSSLPSFEEQISKALIDGFIETDNRFFGECFSHPRKLVKAYSGACVILAYFCCFLDKKYLFVANAGDCRAVLGSRFGNRWTSTPLSVDHSASNPSEIERLQKEHPDDPNVVSEGRVKGILQPTRGIGDGDFKKKDLTQIDWDPPYNIAIPEVQVRALNEDDHFLILASDGLWNFISNEGAVEIVGNALLNDPNLSSINASTLLISEVFKRIEWLWVKEMIKLFEADGERRRLYYDDVTVTVIFFNSSNLEKKETSIQENFF